jgi:hypothetical protein
MKTFSLTLCVIFCCSFGQMAAQNDLRLGVNAAPLVRQFFSLSDEPVALNPYILIAEYKLNSFGLRAGVGFNNSFDTQLPDSNEGTPEIETTSNAMNFRVGYVGYRPLANKWQLKYGADVFYWNTKLDITTITTDFFGNQQTAQAMSATNEYGVSPFLFLQWNINDRLSLATEVLASVSFANDLVQEENSQFPEFNDTDESNRIAYNILPPTALFLIFRW